MIVRVRRRLGRPPTPCDEHGSETDKHRGGGERGDRVAGGAGHRQRPARPTRATPAGPTRGTRATTPAGPTRGTKWCPGGLVVPGGPVVAGEWRAREGRW